MPTKPLRLCNKPGCTALTHERYCEQHTVEQPRRKDWRKSARDRGYDTQWKKFSTNYKVQHPLCALCELEGRITEATEVHHVIPINPARGGGAVFPDNADLLLPMCHSCHKRVEGLGFGWRKAART